MDPEKIHLALAIINSENGDQGATIQEIASLSQLSEEKIKKEMEWGERGNVGNRVIDAFQGHDGSTRYRHTEYYDPDPARTGRAFLLSLLSGN
jgi:hypothetical protein